MTGPSAAGTTAVPVLPARAVPMAAQVGSLTRDDDEMAITRPDVLVAARAQVGLRGFVRLDPPYVHVVHARRLEG
jgi:hypothetical protein